MSTRTARAVGALALTAASLVGTAALAAPAWAATTTARVSFGNLIVPVDRRPTASCSRGPPTAR